MLIKTVFNEQDEANFVVSSIMMDYNRGRNWKENAILYRMNAQSNALEYAFKRNGVPYQVVGGTSSSNARRSRTCSRTSRSSTTRAMT